MRKGSCQSTRPSAAKASATKTLAAATAGCCRACTIGSSVFQPCARLRTARRGPADTWSTRDDQAAASTLAVGRVASAAGGGACQSNGARLRCRAASRAAAGGAPRTRARRRCRPRASSSRACCSLAAARRSTILAALAAGARSLPAGAASGSPGRAAVQTPAAASACAKPASSRSRLQAARYWRSIIVASSAERPGADRPALRRAERQVGARAQGTVGQRVAPVDQLPLLLRGERLEAGRDVLQRGADRVVAG